MRILDYFKLAKNNMFRNKKLFFKNIILIAISITLLLVSYVTTSSINNMLDKNIRYNMNFRTIYINDKNEDDIASTIEKLEKIEHIDKVVEQGNYRINLDIININNKEDKGRINLIGANNKITPKIIKGRGINANEENICIIPKKFYIGDISQIIDESKIIDGESLLNKEIEIAYYTYIHEDGVPTIDKEYHLNLKVVGIYDTDDNMGDYNECYASFELIEEINEHITENLNYDNQFSVALGIVDSAENVENVMNTLSDLNYETFLYSTPNYTLINIIDWVGKIISISIMTLVVINIITDTAKNCLDRKKEMGLLKALGYRKNDIWKIIFVESTISGIISFIMACIMTFIILMILLKLQKGSILEIQKIKIMVTYIPFAICFLISIIIPNIGNILANAKILNKSVINNSKE